MNNHSPYHCPKKTGFTLLELSVVLTIISLVTVMAITSGIAVISNVKQAATTKKMAAIEDALMAYRTANDRLPCPASLTTQITDINYGLEAGAGTGSSPVSATGVCWGASMLPKANFTSGNAAEGGVPVATLGLPNDFMFDGWGNRIRYAVDVTFTAAGTFANTPIAAVCGALKVCDGQGLATSTSCTKSRSNGALYVLLSHGPNSQGAYSKTGLPYNGGVQNTNELANCHCSSSTGAATGTYNAIYVQQAPAYQATYIGKDSYYFDDIVSYKERWQMRNAWDYPILVYVADNGAGNVQRFTSSGVALAPIPFIANGGAASQTNSPWGITADGSGNIWVIDTGAAAAKEFDACGNYITSIALTGTPKSGAFDISGNLWVTDYATPSLKKYSTATTGTGLTASGPIGVTVDPTGNIWVSDTAHTTIYKFLSTGGAINSSFPVTSPVGIAADTAGNIWAANSTTNTIQKYTNVGVLQSQFGGPGSTDGLFTGLKNIMIDSSGNIWVVDSTRVQEFDSSGNFIQKLTGTFTSPTSVLVTR
jgi:prepilin-type N-terminal cleavage/methylation domain-containing protein